MLHLLKNGEVHLSIMILSIVQHRIVDLKFEDQQEMALLQGRGLAYKLGSVSVSETLQLLHASQGMGIGFNFLTSMTNPTFLWN